MMMTIALRFIPTLTREMDDLIKAQRARGVEFKVRDPRRFAQALLPLAVPLFVLSFRRADDLAVAMTSRCYRGGEGRTRYRELRLGVLDGVACACGVSVVVIAVSAGGCGDDSPAGRRGRRPGASLTHRLDIEYDGTEFHGWAVQPGLPTVEGSLAAALRTVVRAEVRLTVAGRTDAGVHARRQVVSVALPAGTRSRPRPRVAERADSLRAGGASHRARSRTSTRGAMPWPAPTGTSSVSVTCASPFWARYRWHVGYPLDLDAMAGRGRAGGGSARSGGRSRPPRPSMQVFERSVTRCLWRVRGDVAWLEIEAPSFLRHMVRSLVGMFVEVGRGRRDLDDLHALLAGAPREEAGPTAPLHGLFLWRIRYPHAP